MTSGIYYILQLSTDKIYIGSTKDIRKRWWEHLCRLRGNKHHSPHLQNAWNKYGQIDFHFGVLEEVSLAKDLLLTREQHWLDHFKSYTPHKGFNISPTASSVLGLKKTPEAIEKIRQGKLGKKIGPCSEERKRKISLAQIGRPKTMSAEGRARQIAAVKSPETRAKMSAGRKAYFQHLHGIMA